MRRNRGKHAGRSNPDAGRHFGQRHDVDALVAQLRRIGDVLKNPLLRRLDSLRARAWERPDKIPRGQAGGRVDRERNRLG